MKKLLEIEYIYSDMFDQISESVSQHEDQQSVANIALNNIVLAKTFASNTWINAGMQNPDIHIHNYQLLSSLLTVACCIGVTKETIGKLEIDNIPEHLTVVDNYMVVMAGETNLLLDIQGLNMYGNMISGEISEEEFKEVFAKFQKDFVSVLMRTIALLVFILYTEDKEQADHSTKH